MASGADTSARMISLVFNIAVMGFVLVQGTMVHLRDTLGVAESAALVSGFGWVMVYGAISVFLLAAVSFFIFSSGRTMQRDGNVARSQSA